MCYTTHYRIHYLFTKRTGVDSSATPGGHETSASRKSESKVGVVAYRNWHATFPWVEFMIVQEMRKFCGTQTRAAATL